MLTYGDIQRDPAKLPEATLKALLQRGFTHVLGNEQASKVVSKARTHISTSLSTPEKEFNQVDVTKEQVQALRVSHPDLFTQWTAACVAEALQAMDEGKLGVRAPGASGPRLDPVASAVQSIARSEVTTKLKANGLKMPKGEEIVTFANGATRTAAQMIANHLGHHGERIRKEAERQVADAARRRAKQEAEAKGKGGSAEELGL